MSQLFIQFSGISGVGKLSHIPLDDCRLDKDSLSADTSYFPDGKEPVSANLQRKTIKIPLKNVVSLYTQYRGSNDTSCFDGRPHYKRNDKKPDTKTLKALIQRLKKGKIKG